MAGGGTTAPGFGERMQMELDSLDGAVGMEVVAPLERKYSVWIGGSLWSSMPSFRDLWISSQYYGEFGAEAIHSHSFYQSN
uniref:Uncharacterized protein n=1 Tax=Arcella intermedia TaxID=1963864 RepID=A0A6B2LUV8_9EUKA